MFVAQSKHIPIHGFTLHENTFIKMCCEGSGGFLLESYSLSELLKLFGNPIKKKDSYQFKCTCCDRFVTVGLVCPISLTVSCKFIPVCKKCKTKISLIK